MVVAQLTSETDADVAKQSQHDLEWQALYDALEAIFIQFGNEDPYCKGDYWIVDDSYGTPCHKVCISRLACGINAMYSKDIFCQIDSDGDNVSHGLPLPTGE